MQKAVWTITPFNKVFVIVALFFLLVLIVSSLFLRDKSENIRSGVLVTYCILTLIGFFIYKHFLSLDADYNDIVASMGGFNWWGELPLHLCNINMLLLPIAILKDLRPLKSFCFFLGPLGALMALVMPANGFDGYSILLPRMIGYYGIHFMIIVEGLALVTYGLFRPRFKDMPNTLLMSLTIMVCIFCLNILMRVTGIYEKANYFFSVETEGNVLLELFRSWIPYPCLYLLPCLGILAVYMCIVTLGFTIFGGEQKK